MSQLQKIIYLTREQYDKLQNNEAVTAGGITLNGIDENNLYFITDETISSDELGDDFILPVKNGGTGVSSITPNSILGTGTTSTAPFIAITKATSITNNANTIPTTQAVYNDALLKSGGTMTGVLTVKGSQYTDAYSGALNMNNSNIYGLNSIYTADSADNASEGIHFYRDGSHTDTLWVAGGNIYFTPNRTLAGSSASTTAANSEKVTRLPTSINGSRVLYSDGTNGKIAESSVTSTELSYLSGVTSAINTTYLKKSGGQMTGPLTWKDSNALPEATSLSYILGIDAFANGGTTKWIGIANLKTALGSMPPTTHTHAYLANTDAGASDRPIYITGNTATQTTYRMAATNATATSALAITTNLNTGIWYVNGTSDVLSQSDGAAYVNKYSDSWIHEIYGDYRTGHIAIRGKNNGTWQNWLTVLDSGNTTSPDSTPTLAWNTESTVFTLNGTPIKIKAMAKPSAADIGAATSDHNHDSTYLKLNGSNNMTADVNIIAGDTDKFVNFWYNTNKTAGASWRIGMLGSGSNDTNYFVIESGTSTTSATAWNRAVQIGQNTYDITIKGNLIPAATETKTLGTSSYKWSNVYATTFTGNLTGNASGTASNITGILALANFTKGATNTALMGKGTSSNPAYVSVSPSISITDGTSSAAPKINLTVLGISGTAQDLTIASTSAYGVTKLYDGVNSSSTEMAATAKAVKTAYDKAVNIIAESNALVYKGIIDGNSSATNGGAYTVAADCGDVYIASTAGYVNGLYVELGDMLICNTDETVQATSSNYTTIRNKWDIIQTSNGTVSTSETSVAEGEIPVFKGTTGRFIQNSEKSFTVNAPTSSSGDSTIPTSKAVWTTVNTAITGLDVAAVGGGTGEYVSKISEADGKISATISTTSVSNTWTTGTTAGPTIKTTVNGITGTAVAIPSASNTASGIITTGNQTFAGIKTFANTTASTSTGTGAVLVSGGLGVTGQVTATRLAANGNNISYNLYVNGTSLLNGNTTVNGNLVPGANNTKTLGSTDAKWSKLYVGSSESYGNAYQPVYWNDGVPAVSYPVQYSTWSISSGDNTATLTGTDIFTADTYVISLVVTSGEQYLNGPITWTSAANTLTLSTAATSGIVEGYVLTSIGTATGATCVSSSVTT